MDLKLMILIGFALFFSSCTKAQNLKSKFSGVWIQNVGDSSSIPPDTLLIKSNGNEFEIIHKNVVKTIKRNSREDGWQMKEETYGGHLDFDEGMIITDLFEIIYDKNKEVLLIEDNQYHKKKQ
jgi:hypothetical protein